MRYFLTFLKWWNHLWAANLTPEQEAQQIVRYMILKSSTAHSIEVYMAVKVAMQSEMRQREYDAQQTIKAVKVAMQSEMRQREYDAQQTIKAVNAVRQNLNMT